MGPVKEILNRPWTPLIKSMTRDYYHQIIEEFAARVTEPWLSPVYVVGGFCPVKWASWATTIVTNMVRWAGGVYEQDTEINRGSKCPVPWGFYIARAFRLPLEPQSLKKQVLGSW